MAAMFSRISALCSYAYLPLLFLLSFILWDRYRLLWQKWQKSPSNGHQEQLESTRHMFIYKSFVIFRSEDFGQQKLVVLFMSSGKTGENDVGCLVENRFGPRRMRIAHLEKMTSLGICALDLVILTCTIEQPQNAGLLGHKFIDNSSYNLLINGDYAKRIELKPMRPSTKPRQLVLCISRVFAFERWQLLLTALEAYRAFKVDLVVTHVQSAIHAIFRMMQIYEREGLLTIRPGIRFPHLMDMPWDPNAETEFNGQILLAHECFYEFRNSASFIGLIDWDDLLVPSKLFGTLPSAFNSALRAHPNTAYFLVNKLESTFKDQKWRNPKTFRLGKFLRKGILTAQMYNDEKLVVVPKRLRGFWMHNSVFLEPGREAVKLYTNYSVLLHLANEERVEPWEFKMPFMRKFNTTAMDGHARDVMAKMNPLVRHELPRVQKYFRPIVDCHRQIFAYYRSMVMDGTPRCVSYSLCVLPTVEAHCMVVQTVWHTKMFKTGGSTRISVHLRESSRFEESKQGCISEKGI